MKTKLELDFEWEFIKDKRIEILDGSDEEAGIIFIIDSEDNAIRMIGYELIDKDKQ